MENETVIEDAHLSAFDDDTQEQDSTSNSNMTLDQGAVIEIPIRKRKSLTLKEKSDIIAAYDENPSLSKVALARRFNLSRTTLHSIVSKRDAIAESLKQFGSYSGMRKKSRSSPFQEIEGKLLLWMQYAKDLNLPVNGFTLRRQARTIAKDLGLDKFTASNGWIERFKNRHNDWWKGCQGSGSVAKEDDKPDTIPLEPAIEIKVEPVDYEPSPSTSNDALNEEFILPHGENSWTTPETLVKSEFTLSVASLSSSKIPDASDDEQPIKKQKLNDTQTSSIVPLTNCSTVSPPSPVYNLSEFSNPGSSKEHRKDEFDVFGEYIAVKLRSLDRRSSAFAQKAIGDIIFEAEMGKYLNQTQKTDS